LLKQALKDLDFKTEFHGFGQKPVKIYKKTPQNSKFIAVILVPPDCANILKSSI
jgi:hypothetical protein